MIADLLYLAAVGVITVLAIIPVCMFVVAFGKWRGAM